MVSHSKVSRDLATSWPWAMTGKCVAFSSHLKYQQCARYRDP